MAGRDIRARAHYNARVRGPRRRLVLPSGELKRLRLPDALDELEPPKAKRRWALPVGVSGGWLALCVGCWALSVEQARPLDALAAQWDLGLPQPGDLQLASMVWAPEGWPARPVRAAVRAVPSPGSEPVTTSVSGQSQTAPASQAASPEASAPARAPLAPLPRVATPASQAQHQGGLQRWRSGGAALEAASVAALQPSATSPKLNRDHINDPAPPKARVAAAATVHASLGCEAAFRRARQEIDLQGEPAPADISRESYAAALRAADFSGCKLHEQMDVQICVAVQNGRAEGVTVTTNPGDARLARCIVRRVQSLRLPRAPNMDLVRTEFYVR